MENNVDIIIEEVNDSENMDAIVILKSELEKDLKKEHSRMVPAEPIIKYLISKCQVDEEFSKRITLEKKSIKECLVYVLQEVKKILNNQNGHVPDPEVYAMAESYYILDEVVIEKSEYEKAKERIKDIPKTTNQTENKITVIPKTQVKKEKEQISLFEF